MNENFVPTEYDEDALMASLSTAIGENLGCDFRPEPISGFQRFAAPGKSASNKACWVKVSEDRSYATYGNFITGQTGKWRADDFVQVSANSFVESNFARPEDTEHLIRKKQSERRVAKVAQKIVLSAKPANASHPYLISKGVKPHGLSQLASALVVPLYDDAGKICSVQYIYPNGDKRFMTGGRTKSAHAIVGELYSTELLYICEGVATALTLFEKIGHAVIASMSANNLLAVCEHYAAVVPDSVTVIIAADNDHRTDGNPGMTKGCEAAKAIGAKLTFPPIPCKARDCRCTDFNDWHQCSKRLGVPNE